MYLEGTDVSSGYHRYPEDTAYPQDTDVVLRIFRILMIYHPSVEMGGIMSIRNILRIRYPGDTRGVLEVRGVWSCPEVRRQ